MDSKSVTPAAARLLTRPREKGSYAGGLLLRPINKQQCLPIALVVCFRMNTRHQKCAGVRVRSCFCGITFSRGACLLFALRASATSSDLAFARLRGCLLYPTSCVILQRLYCSLLIFTNTFCGLKACLKGKECSRSLTIIAATRPHDGRTSPSRRSAIEGVVPHARGITILVLLHDLPRRLIKPHYRRPHS